MQIGFNYSVSHNRQGVQIGPDVWDEDRWDERNALVAKGQVDRVPLPPLFANIDRNLKELKAMGVSVVRWFLLGHGQNYGPSPQPYTRFPPGLPPIARAGLRYRDYTFTPPPVVDPRFRRDFTEMLERFKRAGMQLIPSLLSFEFSSAFRFTTGPRANTGAAGRADIVRDPAKRKVFLDTMLTELLAASAKYKEQIYAWEVINEPEWMYLDFDPGTKTARVPEVTFSQVKDFLADALGRIEAAGFASTVGFRYFGTLRQLPTGTRPQFHYYAANEWWRHLTPGYPTDPAAIRGAGLFAGKPKPFLGEFSSDLNDGLARAWTSDFPSGDTTYARMQLLEKEGCDFALIWPDTEWDGKEDDKLKLRAVTRAAIARYTGGKP